MSRRRNAYENHLVVTQTHKLYLSQFPHRNSGAACSVRTLCRSYMVFAVKLSLHLSRRGVRKLFGKNLYILLTQRCDSDTFRIFVHLSTIPMREMREMADETSQRIYAKIFH